MTIGERGLGAGIDQLADEVHELRDAVDRDRRIRRMLLTLVVLVGFGFGTLYLRLSNVASGNRHSVEILIDCTTPGTTGHPHVCYDRAQANQQAAVRQIVDSNHNGILDTEEILAYLQGKAPKPAP